MNGVALVCMIAAGTVLPLMDIVFGKFINVFNDFVTGELTADGYMDEVGKYTYVFLPSASLPMLCTVSVFRLLFAFPTLGREGVERQMGESLLTLGSLYFVYLFIAKFALTYAWTVLVNITAIRTTKKLRVDFVRQTLRQEISFFDAPSSSVSGQITTNGNLVNNGISEKLGLTIQAVASFVTAFVVAFAVQWKLTLILLAIVPLNLIVTIWCVVEDTVLEYRMFDIYSESGSLAEEAFSTIRTAHAFWAFPKLVERFGTILERARRVGKRKSLIYAILFPVEFFCVIAGYALAFWQGIRMYSTGEIQQPGTVVTVIFAVLVAAQALTQIAPQTIAISKATAAAQDLFAIIDRKSAIDSLSAEGTRIADFTGDVKLRGVKFSYPSRPGVPVLHGLDLDIPSDKTTALVGASGSGKSTIFGMLERWYAISAGTITLDGHRLEDLNLQWLRTNIRLVQQEPTLFSGTIYQNVVDGLTGTDMVDLPDDEKRRLVREACQAAYAHDFIEDLPKVRFSMTSYMSRRSTADEPRATRRTLASAAPLSLVGRSNASSSPVASSRTRRFCSSTRPPRRSTPTPKRLCKRPSTTSPRVARWSSLRTASAPSATPTTSSSCPKARRSSPAPTRSSSPSAAHTPGSSRPRTWARAAAAAARPRTATRRARRNGEESRPWTWTWRSRGLPRRVLSLVPTARKTTNSTVCSTDCF